MLTARSSRLILSLALVAACSAATLHAQSPFDIVAFKLEQAFTGPIVRAIATICVVAGGFTWAMGRGSSHLPQMVLGLGLAIFGAQFVAWLF